MVRDALLIFYYDYYLHPSSSAFDVRRKTNTTTSDVNFGTYCFRQMFIQYTGFSYFHRAR